MDEATRRGIEAECTRLCLEYARAVDFRDADAFADCFSEDAFLQAGPPVAGREKIRRGIQQRDPKLRSRHVMTNILIDVHDEARASGITYLSLYRHVGPESEGAAPVLFEAPAAVGHYEDEFVRTDEGWRIARRVLHLAFMRPDAFPDAALRSES